MPALSSCYLGHPAASNNGPCREDAKAEPTHGQGRAGCSSQDCVTMPCDSPLHSSQCVSVIHSQAAHNYILQWPWSVRSCIVPSDSEQPEILRDSSAQVHVEYKCDLGKKDRAPQGKLSSVASLRWPGSCSPGLGVEQEKQEVVVVMMVVGGSFPPRAAPQDVICSQLPLCLPLWQHSSQHTCSGCWPRN